MPISRLFFFVSLFLTVFGSNHQNETFNLDGESFIDYFETSNKTFISIDFVIDIFNSKKNVRHFRKRDDMLKKITEFAKKKNIQTQITCVVKTRKNQKGFKIDIPYVEFNILLQYMKENLPPLNYRVFAQVLQSINNTPDPSVPSSPTITRTRAVDSMTPAEKARKCSPFIKKTFCGNISFLQVQPF